ncbi:carboxypeptidase regulatory-like domain-containing protein [Fictibacillus aquaticus]|uniref:PEGA domain-containing protein n=1 Tax=Fictibacillus aquaticus TaxID=2021314 RepID=A0A235FB86_9BACL|nr:carboxypeptidase regulatory-like domain-containing protein [Fictibacillus aquaticus]OYD58610.1 hypothetical protein CGZ90_01530 [Fictibacillus aquaticus]
MKRKKIQSKVQRIYIVILSLLLILTTYSPVSATGKKTAKPAASNQLLIEKQREEEFKSKKVNLSQAITNPALLSVNSGLDKFLAKSALSKGNTLPDHQAAEKKEKEKIELAFKKNDKINIIIRSKERPNLTSISPKNKSFKNRKEKIQYIQQSLKNFSETTQSDLSAALNNLAKQGKAKKKDNLWIINGMTATVTEDAYKTLLARNDVDSIVLDELLTLPDDPAENSSPKLPQWNLEKVNATKVWEKYGLKGEGVVVGIMDSGVDANHEALKHNYRGRDGQHQYSWIDLSGEGYQTPQDGNGHGTHVAGTAVGGGTGEPVGAAPEAEWIAAKIFDDSGSSSLSAIHKAFQWFMAPGGDPSKAPHLVNNSWGNANPYNPEFHEDVKAWVSAGIFPVFSAGNNGPGSQTIGSPGSFPESFTVGATDSYDQVASFSSRGPVYWPDENGESTPMIKPDISAPGHQIYSAWPGIRNEGKYDTLSGTSMASPLVSGSIALLFQANPDLSIDEVKSILIKTARKEPQMGSLPNQQYGAGILNIYQAVTEAAFSGTLIGTLKNKDGKPVAGTISIAEENIQQNVSEDGSFTLRVNAGLHEVKVSAYGYKDTVFQAEIKKGEEFQTNVVLEKSETFKITGTLKMKEGGEPVPFAYIRLLDTQSPDARTDKNGTFSFSSVPEGSYTINVYGEKIHSISKKVTISSNTELNLLTETVSASPEDTEWKTANQNITRNAVSPHAVDISNLEKSWEYKSENRGDILFSTPAVSGENIVLVTENGWVVSLDMKSGKEKWSFQTGGFNRSSPTIDHETVYVSGGEQNKIYALYVKSGAIKWTAPISDTAVYESPIVLDGKVIVSSGMTEKAQVTAFDADDGKKIWNYSVGAPVYFGASSGGGLVYVGSYDDQSLRALNIEDGTEVWTKAFNKEGVVSRPVYEDGDIYVTGTNLAAKTGSLYRLDGKTGEEKWHISGIGDTQANSPLLYKDLVIIGSASQPYLRAYEKSSGSLKWENKVLGTSVHNGSISSSGVLFFTGSTGKVSAVDVLTGKVLKEFSIPSISSSGLPITAGKLIVPHRKGILLYESPGILTGQLTDEKGNSVQGTVTIAETGVSSKADSDGNFILRHKPGTYTIQISQYGKKQHSEETVFVSGYQTSQNYELKDADTGSLTITVQNKRTGKPVPSAAITLEGTPVNGKTDSDGKFISNEIFEGTYTAQLKLDGYQESTVTIAVLAGEENSVNVNLQPYDIAVLDDYNNEMTSFLLRSGYAAEERGWDIIDDIGRYQVLLLNGSYGTAEEAPAKEKMQVLIDAAKNHDVSILFTDQWGDSYGSIQQLSDYWKDPGSIGHYYGRGIVRIQVDAEHPIFKDFKKGDRVDLFNGSGDFAWFTQYSGRSIGKIGNDTLGFTGSGVAYKAVSSESAHLLLSSHAAVPWSTPKQWLPSQQKILLNGLDYLFDSKFGEITGTIVNESGEPVDAQIEILETGVTVNLGENFSFFHDEGTFNADIRAQGYASLRAEIAVKAGQPAHLNIVLKRAEGGILSGTIKDAVKGIALSEAHITLKNAAAETVAESVTSSNGRYHFENLQDDQYTLIVEKDGYISHRQKADLSKEDGNLDISLYTTPRVGVVGDYYDNDDNFKALLKAHGISASDIAPVQMKEKMKDFDVVFINEPSTSSITKSIFDEMLNAADESETSLIFGEAYYSGSGINHLVRNRQDPKERVTVRNTAKSAQYKIINEHPIFSGAKAGDIIELLNPASSSVSYFKNYSGYPLAEIKHEGSDTTHGIGVAYKPRTAGSAELLMSGHGFTLNHSLEDYTEEGKELLVQSVLWASNASFPSVKGKITDDEGKPLQASIKVKDQPVSTVSKQDGSFSIALPKGTYELEVSAFGYEQKSITAQSKDIPEQVTLSMDTREDAASLSGTVEDEKDGNAVEGAELKVIDKPRSSVSSSLGQYSINKLEPGTYTIRLKKDGYVQKDITVKVAPGELAKIDIKLRPSPVIGIIGDYISSGKPALKPYLESLGFKTITMTYKDLDKLSDVDLVYANSDYAPGTEPTKLEFQSFQDALDKNRVSVIWTGHNGGRGSIRFLKSFIDDPSAEITGSRSGAQGTILKEHPLTEGLELQQTFSLPARLDYYYGFNGYSGNTVVSMNHPQTGENGSLIAFKERTMDSVEILLGSMVFSYNYLPGETSFDPTREKLLKNALSWALDKKETAIGELDGTVLNESGFPVNGEIFIKETGKKITADLEGRFFTALNPGDYNITIQAFGHNEQTFSLKIEKGKKLQKTFILTPVNAGVLTGRVLDADTNNVLKDASIAVIGTPVEARSDELGKYRISLPEGSYDVRIKAEGYTPAVKTVQINSGSVTEHDELLKQSEKIAVLGNDYNKSHVLSYLGSLGYETDFYTYTDFKKLSDNMTDYKLIILNDLSYTMTADHFKAFVNKADQLEVSLIFPSQYSLGSMNDLSKVFGDPKAVVSSYVTGSVLLKANHDHPIFRGFSEGQEIEILSNGTGTVQYSAYSEYSGTTIGTLHSNDGKSLGEAIGYKFSSPNSVHVLLSSMQLGGNGRPGYRWTKQTEQLYANAIDYALNASQSEIHGKITDTNGTAISQARITVPGTSFSAVSNERGEYRIGIGKGTYTVLAKARGYEDQSKTVNVPENSQAEETNFTLTEIKRVVLSGTITDKELKQHLSGAKIILTPADDPNLAEETASDDKGYYEFTGLLPGEYTINIAKKGYLPIEHRLSIGSSNSVWNAEMNAAQAAVIGDLDDVLTNFLNSEHLYSEQRDWDVIEDIQSYKLIVLNTNKGTTEQMKKLISESDKHHVSLIFTGTWGVKDGSLHLLKTAEGSPDIFKQGYNEGSVFLKGNTEHPIYSGIKTDEKGRIHIHSQKSPYATIKGYKGISLGGLFVNEDDKGESISYDFRSKEHMHMILSSFAVTNIIGPEYGWTKDGKQLYLNALRWAKDAEQEKPAAPSWDREVYMAKQQPAIVSGQAQYSSTVKAYAIHGNRKTLVGTAQPNRDGTFQMELNHLSNGQHTLFVEAENFAGITSSKSPMKIIITGKPVQFSSELGKMKTAY